MSGFDTDFDAFKIIAFVFPILFIFVFAGIFLTLLKVLKRWNDNNKQPQLSMSAKLITKRTKFSHQKGHNQIRQSSTSYFLTFEVGSGDRIEFRVDGLIYGKFIENDMGVLTFQGTRFIKFER